MTDSNDLKPLLADYERYVREVLRPTQDRLKATFEQSKPRLLDASPRGHAPPCPLRSSERLLGSSDPKAWSTRSFEKATRSPTACPLHPCAVCGTRSAAV